MKKVMAVAMLVGTGRRRCRLCRWLCDGLARRRLARLRRRSAAVLLARLVLRGRLRGGRLRHLGELLEAPDGLSVQTMHSSSSAASKSQSSPMRSVLRRGSSTTVCGFRKPPQRLEPRTAPGQKNINMPKCTVYGNAGVGSRRLHQKVVKHSVLLTVDQNTLFS